MAKGKMKFLPMKKVEKSKGDAKMDKRMSKGKMC